MAFVANIELGKYKNSRRVVSVTVSVETDLDKFPYKNV